MRFHIISDFTLLLNLTLIIIIIYSMSFIFLERFLIKRIMIGELFRSQFKIKKYVDDIIHGRNKSKIRRFEKHLNYFTGRFNYLFGTYFRYYKKRLKPKKFILNECYIFFDKIINIVGCSIETKSKKTNDLLVDFHKYTDDMKIKIFIPILEKEILIIEANKFFIKWNNFFQKKYPQEYKNSNEYFEKYIEKIHEKYIHRQELRRNILIASLNIITLVVLFIASYVLIK